MTQDGPVRVEVLEDGAVWLVLLARPKGNVLDREMTTALQDVFERAASAADLKAVLLEGEGRHFSFGASVEEHQPDQVAAMLATFHTLFRTMARAAVTVVAVVRGQCLGGGLELAAWAHRVVGSPDAQLGQPEIRLGVFAPAASVLLPERLRRRDAEDLCLTGRSVAAEEAARIGLVDEVAEDPRAAALSWVRAGLLPHSAASLRRAVRAVRLGLDRRLHEDLAEVERIYLEDLMETADAKEGIAAFLEKRGPQWRNA